MGRFEVPVPISVDVDAIAASHVNDVSRRMGEAVMLAMEWLEQDNNPLNDLQKKELIRTAVLCMDGLEAELRENIERDLRSTVKVALEKNGGATGKSNRV